MNHEEIRLRSLYLFLACSRAVEESIIRLKVVVEKDPPHTVIMTERILRRELGLVFRYWMTRQIWDVLDNQQEDAKALNLSLLRLCTQAFAIPQDGSGLRYAELSSLAEETDEVARRVTDSLGSVNGPLLHELQLTILPWRDAICRYTSDGLALSIDRLASSIEAWAGEKVDSSSSEGDLHDNTKEDKL